MFEFIWGLKTVALFDVWTFIHVLSGLSIGNTVKKNNLRIFKKKFGLENNLITTKYYDIVGVLFLAYAWESIEHYLETGLAGAAVEYWFQGVEFWGNRLITDPLAMVLGYLIAKRYPAFIMPARAASLAWFFTHVLVFPHSMYLQAML